MTIQVFGPQSTVSMLNRAFNDASPANANFQNQVARVGSIGERAFANEFAASAAGLSDAALASKVLGNMGLLPNADLLAGLTSYLTANASDRGFVVLQLGQILSSLENATGAQAIYNTAAVAWNDEVGSAFTYSSNAANTSVSATGTAPTVGVTTVLTISATDVLNGGSGDDTFIGQVGQSTTLQASDKVTGGAGTDTLRVVTDNNGATTAQSVSGFTSTGVEVLEVQAQATGGTTLSLENVTGVTTLRSTSSNSALTLNQVKAIADLEVTGALGAQAMTVSYQAAAVSGSADVQKVALNGNELGALTVDGVETLAISTATASSKVASIAGTAFSKVTVAGDKALTITAALPTTVKTVDASAQTAGGVTVTAGVADVAVTGGAGDDKATFTGDFKSTDSFNGGAGTDTIVANQGEYTGSSYAAAAKISNVEVIEIADALTANFDASKIAGENQYTLAAGFTGPVTISKADDASTVNVKADSTGTLTYSITDATNTGTANTLNIAVGGANGIAAGTIDASGVETLTLASNGSATTAGGNTLVIVDTAVTKLTQTGKEDMMLTLDGSSALVTLDASASSGVNDFSAVKYKGAATISGGSGIDKIVGSTGADTITGGEGADVISGGSGGDTITGGAGADTFGFSAVTDSQGTSQDVIADFVSGTDMFNFATLAQAAGRSEVVLKSGSAADFGSAQAAIALNSGKTQVVYQADNNTLWVDLNDDGTLNNNDLSIKLTGVTKVTAADVGGTATAGGTGNYITLTAAAAVVNATTATNANAFTTTFNDNITSTVARLAGSTIDGLAGTDVLALSDTISATTDTAIPATVTNVESINLATVGTTANGDVAGSWGITFNDAGIFTNVNGTANVDVIKSTADLIESGTINLGAGNDAIVALARFEDAAGADTSYKFNIDMGAGDDAVTATTVVTWTADSKVVGGDGTDTLTLANASDIVAGSITGFETLNLAGTATMTLAQYNSFTNVAASQVAANTVTLTTAGTLKTTAVAANDVGVETYTLAAGANTVTTGGTAAANQTVTGTTGVETFNTTVANAVWHTFTAAGGADVLNITGGMTAALEVGTNAAAAGKLKVTGLETVNVAGASTANTLTLVSATAAELTTINASGVTGGGITLDVSGLTGAATGRTITLTGGNDTLATGIAITAASTIDFGAGATDAVADNTANPVGLLTLKAAPQAGGTHSISFNATTKDLATGSATGTLLDFTTDITAIQQFAVGTAGKTAIAGGIWISNNAADTTFTLDVDGNGVYGAGDIQVVLVGQIYTGATATIVGGNLQL